MSKKNIINLVAAITVSTLAFGSVANAAEFTKEEYNKMNADVQAYAMSMPHMGGDGMEFSFNQDFQNNSIANNYDSDTINQVAQLYAMSMPHIGGLDTHTTEKLHEAINPTTQIAASEAGNFTLSDETVEFLNKVSSVL